jgi:hypothetical protein
MSWQASKYARAELEHGVDLRASTRLVLMLLAEAAGSRTAIAIGGGWLSVATGMSEQSIRRAIHELGEAGLIEVMSNPPSPLRARFPIAAAISTTRAPVSRLEDEYPRTGDPQPAHRCAPTRAPVRAIPHRTGSIPQRSVCELCDDTGWEYLDDRHVRPCSGCAA